MSDDIRVRRFAVKFDPPTLVVEYQTNEGLFLKKIRMKKVSETTDVDRVVKQIMKKNSDILDESKINVDQLKDLIALLLSTVIQESSPLPTSSNPPLPLPTETSSSLRKDTTTNNNSYLPSPFNPQPPKIPTSTPAVIPILEKFEDLNKAPDEIVELVKKQMDVGFTANRLAPGDEGYVWDKRVDFVQTEEVSCEWDDEDEDDEDDNEDEQDELEEELEDEEDFEGADIDGSNEDVHNAHAHDDD